MFTEYNEHRCVLYTTKEESLHLIRKQHRDVYRNKERTSCSLQKIRTFIESKETMSWHLLTIRITKQPGHVCKNNETIQWGTQKLTEHNGDIKKMALCLLK
jgi:hypothetical protein